jgi:cytochrome c oxidase cbb3-type subunit 4
MDINLLRSIAAVLGLLTFVGIIFWAWSAKNAERFNEAAQLPFEQDVAQRGTK